MARFPSITAKILKPHRSAIYMRDGLGASLQAQYRWGFGDIYTQLLWQSSQYQKKWRYSPNVKTTLPAVVGLSPAFKFSDQPVCAS